MKFKKLKSLAICLVIIASFAVFFQVRAVSVSTISVDIVPFNPAPLENTTITLSSYGSNLDSVSISWFVAGKKVSSGVGMKSFNVTAPNAGAETIVRAVISLPDGAIEKNIIIRPNVMVLLWQATSSYTPPFYRGKALPMADSEIKVVAIPEIKNRGVTVNPKNMVYSWKLNYVNDVGSSGYGKNFFRYTNDYLENSENIAVVASTTDGRYSSEANLNIGASIPKILFYKHHPDLGILWEQALKDGYKIVGSETLVAEPYFMSPKELWSPSLVWNWYLNNNLTNNTLPYRENWIPLKVEGGVSGVSTLRLDIENKQQFLGGASKEMRLEF